MADYDYTTVGAYFVTVVTHRRQRLLATMSGSDSVPTTAGIIVRETWEAIPARYAGVEIDASIVMPDHVHGILWLSKPVLVTSSDHRVPRVFTLSDVIQRFKTLTTHRYIEGVRQHQWPRFDGHLWQRSYHDRVIRDDAELHAIREYIEANPLRSALSRTFP